MKTRTTILLICAAALCACAQVAPYCPVDLDGTAWVQTSQEYRMLCAQAYRNATEHLGAALADTSWTAALEQEGEFAAKPPAVILDVDETVLDNSLFQGTAILEKHPGFDKGAWDAWLAQRAATPVPGALTFIKAARAKGVAVFYLTNRECKPRPGKDAACPQETDTLENLRELGFPDVTADALLLKSEQADWTSEKASRRKLIAENYRIVMLVGDDLGDFLPDVKKNTSVAARRKAAEARETWWGTRWFVLPNPIYGSWEAVIGYGQDDKTGALKGFR